MNAIFLQSGYVLKRQGLAIAAKYRLTGLQGEPLLFIEEKIKWIPPSTSVHMYADEKKTREVLTFKDGKSADVGTDIFDAESGQKIGGIGTTADNLAEFIKDAWVIVDAEDKPVAKVAERSTGQSIARELLSHDLPQQLDIKVGETLVAELRQKVKLAGYELEIDFSMDTANLLDHRLGIAAAVHVALHQGREV